MKVNSIYIVLGISSVCCGVLAVISLAVNGQKRLDSDSVKNERLESDETLLPVIQTLQLQEESILDQIRSYSGVADKIIDLAIHGAAKHQSYNRLAKFTDKFGNRIAGSKNLEHSIDYLLKELKHDGLDNVHGEPVMVPHWVRGQESAVLLEPLRTKIALLGLGSSVGTPQEGITAEVIVVKSFDELHERADEVQDKIVVYNQDYISYGTSVVYRRSGAVEAAKLGAVASLIRSVAPGSIYSPHTGQQDYEKDVKKIPTACITIEDAEMLNRMADRGDTIIINLKMHPKMLPPVQSRNTIADIKGYKYPDQIVLVSGHIDSWDVGKGAMDDGGGAFISWQVLSLLKKLKLRPKRTVRMVMWTAEEQGGYGGNAYYDAHKGDISKYALVMESDTGTFKPLGLKFKGNSKARYIMKHILQLLKPINATRLSTSSGPGTDIDRWTEAGVPGASLDNANEKYFYFHHSDGDTMTVQNPHEMDLCAALWAVVAYVAADLDILLPR